MNLRITMRAAFQLGHSLWTLFIKSSHINESHIYLSPEPMLLTKRPINVFILYPSSVGDRLGIDIHCIVTLYQTANDRSSTQVDSLPSHTYESAQLTFIYVLASLE